MKITSETTLGELRAALAVLAPAGTRAVCVNHGGYSRVWIHMLDAAVRGR